jgi:hypothetical protein
VRTLLVATALLLATGAALRLAPVRVPVADTPRPESPRLPEEPGPAEQAGALLAYEEIVRDNVFDRTRQPPAERYLPPELAAARAAEGPATRIRRGPRLFGLAVGPDGSVALIDADPRIPGAEVYRPGDLVGGARLVTVTDSSAVLVGPAGTTVLRLPSSRP